ncbi:MAG: phosphoribosylaminoimidazolesuccinocarboxamide synthase [Candidatus Margulisbacteria bacterium]|nr:phosphoribosylaminoimidazolesuccinocarboxamide synthase [Candidatus Margulisiibacteriota bacterium]
MRDISLPGIKKVKSGKVREVFEISDKLLIVATDRISAFDYILPQTIPDKGKVLNSISEFWFNYLEDIIPNHMITAEVKYYPQVLQQFKDILNQRSMLVKKTEVVKLECIVRGYITGSGWTEYQQTGKVCGIELSKGLLKSQKLEEPIFTPSTKAEEGHDENIDEKKAIDIVGKDVFETVKDKSLRLYSKARDFAENRGIIIADTKFEFGVYEGQIILIDEALTPDSSRFWPLDQYEVGKEQPSFDKQFVRNYLLDINWDKKPPVPDLPEDVVQKTSEKYKEAYTKLTSESL